MSSNYGNDSIRALSDREAMRLRPANSLGSDDIHGVYHTLKEIVDNSIDEVKAGYGAEVVITKHENQYYSVKDSGRGVPLAWNPIEEKYNYELVFMQLNSGGKYSAEEDGTFEWSAGYNGIGSSAVAFTSEKFLAISNRDKKKYTLTLNEGEFENFTEEDGSEYTGTFVKWKPDLQVFKENDIPFDWIKTLAKEQASINSNTKVIAIDETSNKTFEFYYENGITDYLKEVSGGSEMTSVSYYETDAKGSDREDLPEYRARFQVAFTFNNEVNSLTSYHNSNHLKEGGSPADAVKSSFAYAIHRYIADNNLYKKKEKRVTWDDISDSLLIITNTYSMQTSYKNQTKHAISNEFIRDYMNTWLRENLEVYFTENPKEAKIIAEQVLINKRSSETAETNRKRIREQLSKEVDNLAGRTEKFVNCKSKDKNVRELYIVEGDSALGSVKAARNTNTQAMYALRGKFLNTLKASIDRALGSDVIRDLLRIIDTGVEVRGSSSKSLNTFDISRLPWSKIILTADQDVDGGHINTLILTLLYRFTPQLIEEGKVYIAVSPLYELVYKDRSIFAYSEEEKNELLKEHGDNCILQRSKGLGENTKEVMYETVMNPKTRNLVKITLDDYDDAYELLNSLMGDNIKERKKIVSEYLKEYVKEMD